jgi:hypothetical protein
VNNGKELTQKTDVGDQIPDAGKIKSIWHLASGIWHLASGIWHLASDLH